MQASQNLVNNFVGLTQALPVIGRRLQEDAGGMEGQGEYLVWVSVRVVEFSKSADSSSTCWSGCAHSHMVDSLLLTFYPPPSSLPPLKHPYTQQQTTL